MNENTKALISLYKKLIDCESSLRDNREVFAGIALLKSSIEKSFLKAEDLPAGIIDWNALSEKLTYGAKVIGNTFKHLISVSSKNEIMRIDDRSICKIVQLSPDRFLVLYSAINTVNPMKLYLSRKELISSFHSKKRQE